MANRIRGLILLLAVAAVLFASATGANAIGFDAEERYESVFVIYCGNSLGSGFAVGENCIVTNAHVVDSMRLITVVTYGGKEYGATLLGMDAQADIAVLAVEGAEFPYLPIADVAQMKLGDDVYAVGAPKGMTYTLTKGALSAKERMIGNQSYIQIDAPINEGNSGGPLLNDAGQVIGMNTLKMTDSEGIGLAIPMERVCSYMRTLGIPLNEGGNVDGAVEGTPTPEVAEPSENRPDNDSESKGSSRREEKRQDLSYVTYLAFFVAGVSLLVNVLLVVLLVQKKKKPKIPPCDPSERTDFEIEFLE